MKVLINNYSSPYTTEPLYFNTILNTIQCESTLWPNGVSTFDIFDIVKPDVHITHHSHMTLDLITYLKENKTKIDLIINITGMDQDQINKFESFLKDNGINPALFFINYYDHNLVSKKINVLSLLHGADIFLGSGTKQYDIDYAIIVEDKGQISPIGETYHYITQNNKCSEGIDMIVSIEQLANMYVNYRNIVFKFFNGIIPQSFFDACVRNNNVFFDIHNRSILDEHLKKIFGEDSTCDMNYEQKISIMDKIKQKHTCLNRAKSLLSQLPCKEYTDRLQTIIEGSIK